MNLRRTHKKNLIISYKSLTEELLQLFQERYPEGYKDYLQRFDKPNGETIFVVPLETDDSVYMIKFDVKIDTAFDDDDGEKDYFDEEVEKAGEEFAPLQEAIDKEDEETGKSTVREVRHGAYEDIDKPRKRISSGSLGALGDELKEAFADDIDEDEYDEYTDDGEDDDEDKEAVMGDDYEPTDEELMSIDSAVYANAEIPPEELARMAAEESAAEPKKSKRGRKKKVVDPEPAPVPAAPKKKGRPRKIKE